jgi:hypothetical protein
MGYSKSKRPFPAVILVMSLAVLSGLVGCASSSQQLEPVNYPHDLTHPFLRLEQVIGGAQDAPKGLLGKILGAVVGPEQQFTMNQPTDMVIDQLGRLLIVESEAGYISIYSDVDGMWQNSDRIHVREILHPTSIAAGLDRIFISDLMGGTVHILDYDFNVVGEINHADMRRPGGLCFDSFGNRLLIADPPANRVFVFTPSGEYVAIIGRVGHSNSKLQSPIDMTVDSKNGHIYVLDAMARKIKQYDTNFQFISTFGAYDQVPGSFAFPKGIALASDGTLFVGDAAFGNIQMFDPNGALLFFFGETGTGHGQFLLPRNLFMDQDQRLFIADPYNNRVQIFRYFPQ